MLSTFDATPNIALVKYWGKRDEGLMLPAEGSISATMDEQLRTRTSVLFSDSLRQDEVILNNERLESRALEETLKPLELVRARAGIKTRAKVVSINCFPTAAGFASSASGFAALACAASKAAGLKLDAKELSILARMGSGSACRSVLGGFVEWRRGERQDGSDSYAEQLAPASHWPEMRNVIAVVDAGKKKVSSRAGMRQTVETSGLFKQRIADLPKTLSAVRRAIAERDGKQLFELAMRESSNMHAVMLDTWPPIIYLNDVSREMIYAVNDFNSSKGEVCAGYTFDAGPNAHVYTTERYAGEVERLLRSVDGVGRIITCRVGDGPREIGAEGALIDEEGKVRGHGFDEKKGLWIE